MQRQRWKVFICLLMFGALVVSGCGGGGGAAPTPAPAPGPSATPSPAPSGGGSAKEAPATIKVGAVVPLTGRYGGPGPQVRDGYEIAVEHINAAGGVMVEEYGKRIPLELILFDDESDPTKTVALMETLNDEHQITAYLGGFGSDMHAAAAAIAEKNKIPYLGVAFALEAIHKQGYQYLFSPFPKSSVVGRIYDVLEPLLPADQIPKKVAIFQEKTDYGLEQAQVYRNNAEEFGAEVVVYEEYAPGTNDYSDLIGKAKAAGADILLAVPNPPDGMAMAKQIEELDYNPAVIMFIRAPDALTWGENLGSAGNNYIFSPGWHHTAQFPGVDKVNETHKQKRGAPAEIMVGPGYSCLQILADAIERAGTLDHQAVRDAIAAADLQTVVGKITFDQYGIGSAQPFWNQWQNGQQENIFPKESATAPLGFPAR